MSTNLECPLEFGVHLWATVPIEYSFPFLVATIFDFRDRFLEGRGVGETQNTGRHVCGETHIASHMCSTEHIYHGEHISL